MLTAGSQPVPWITRLERPLAFGLVVAIAGFGIPLTWFRWSAVQAHGLVGGDLTFYQSAARRFLETGTQYLQYQLAGHYNSQPQVAQALLPSLHPPPALGLFLPFLYLPAFLWWAIPLGVIGWALRDSRPRPWTWPVLAAFLVWPGTSTPFMVGNTTMWGMAAVAAGLRWNWPVAFLVLKPSFMPFAIVGAGRRSFWIATAGLAIAGLALLPEWGRWFVVLRNGTADASYSLGSYPALLIPIVAWFGSPVHRDTSR